MKIKLFILSVVFLVTCVFVYKQQDTVSLNKPPLRQYLDTIDHYKLLSHIPLAADALEMLDLDDYFYADYKGPTSNVNLYIGYYYSANKAYAAHSPLICYPSQGWKIDEQSPGRSVKIGSHQINYDEITTSLGGRKELVLFWYQAHEQTNTDIIGNKIDMGYSKLMQNGEQHGFVRVSVPFVNVDHKQAKQTAMDFIAAFYPHLIEFVKAEE